MILSQEIFGTLSADEVQKTLSSCYLLEKSEYTDDERHIFHECRSLIEQGKSSEELAQHFSYRSSLPQVSDELSVDSESKAKFKKAKTKKPDTKLLNIIEMQSMASEMAEVKISLPEVLKIINACGLPTQDEYSQQECDRFIAACTLKQQGKTYKEIAAEFGIDDSDEQQNVLLAEVEQMMDLAIAQLSSVQAEQIRQVLPKMSLAQLREIKAKFWRSTALKLREYVDSGQMEVEIRAAAEIVVNERSLNLAPVGDPKQKTLPGN
jgi:antirestriction protein